MRALARRVCSPTSFGASASAFWNALTDFLAAAGRGIGAAKQVVRLRITLAGFDHLGQRFSGKVRPSLGELQPRQHLVAGEVIRRARNVSPDRLLGLRRLAKLLLDDALQEVAAWNSRDECVDLVERRIGRLVVLRLHLQHRLQVARLHIAGGRLQHDIKVGLRLVGLARGDQQSGAVQQRPHVARLIGQHLVEHGKRAGCVAPGAQ